MVREGGGNRKGGGATAPFWCTLTQGCDLRGCMFLCNMGAFLWRVCVYFCEFFRFSVRCCAFFYCQDGLQKSTKLRRIMQECAQSAFMQYLGAGVLRKFGADLFCVFFGFHLPDKWNVQTGFLRRFLVRRFLRPFLHPFLVRRFLRPILRRFLVRRFLCPFLRPFLRPFSADFSSTFWRLKNRCSRVTQKCAENARKNPRRPNGPARGGTPFPLRFLKQTACHITAGRPTYSRRACERPSWHLWAEMHACICSKIFQKWKSAKNELCETPAPKYPL